MRVLTGLFLLSVSLFSQPSTRLFDNLSYRFIGPAVMGGRVTDVEAIPGQPHIAYMAAGGGGLWKSSPSSRSRCGWIPRWVSSADLYQQFDTGMKLHNMIGAVNQALRDLDQVKAQLEANEKAAPASAKARVAAMKKELEGAFGRFEAGGVRYRVMKAPKLNEELGPSLL